jgi:hypothetical protein
MGILNVPSRSNPLVYALLLVAHGVLVWLLPYFPSQDGPCHIYNLLILHDLIHGGREWGSYFVSSLHPVPNLGFDLVAYPLIHFFSPFVAERVFLSIYIMLLGLSVPILFKAFDRPIFPFAYFVFPVIFNYALLMGFYSYVITIPLFILSFSLAWNIRSRSVPFKFVCFNLSGLILYYFHLIPSVLYILSLITITLTEYAGSRNKVRQLLLLFSTISPTLMIFIFYFGHGTERAFPDFSYLFSLARFISLMKDLFSFSTINLSRWQLLPGSLFMSVTILSIYSSMKRLWQTKRNAQEPEAQEKVLLMMAVLLTLIYLLAPTSFGGGANFNQRFPWVILIILLPLLRLPQAAIFARAGSAIIAGPVVIFFAFNAAILWEENVKIGKFLGGLQADIPRGAFVMAYKTKSPDWARVDTLLHAASYYSISKGCVDAGNYEASFDYFQVRFKNNVPPLPSENQISLASANIRWFDYPSIHFLLGWEIDNKERIKLNDYFHVIWEDWPLTVWQRNSI